MADVQLNIHIKDGSDALVITKEIEDGKEVEGQEREEAGAAGDAEQGSEAEGSDQEVDKAAWSTAFINNLPDSSFLWIEPGGSKDGDGKTTPRSLRHFPYKDASGKIDLPHLRNALARIPQSNVPADVKSRLTSRAQGLLHNATKSEDLSTPDVVTNWREHWHEALPITGKALPYVLHAHVKGLSADDVEKPWEDIIRGNHEIHYDLRLGSNRFDGYWGFTLDGINHHNVVCDVLSDPSAYTPSMPKFFGPSHWLQIGVKEPYVLENAVSNRDGASTFSKFFVVDRGVWKLASATEKHVEMWLFGELLKGRYSWQHHEETAVGRAGWRFQRMVNSHSFADQYRLEEVLESERSRGGRYVIWPRDTGHLERGAKIYEVEQLDTATKYEVVKAAADQQYTLGVAYPAREIDAHRDYASVDDVEKAAWRFLAKGGKVGLMHRPGTAGAGVVVESYIYRFDPVEYNGQRIEPGDWLLGVLWSDPAWADIKAGRITGFSIQGLAVRKPSAETGLRNSLDNEKAS